MADNFDEYLAGLTAQKDANDQRLLEIKAQLEQDSKTSLEEGIGGALVSGLPLLLGGLLGGTQGGAAAAPIGANLGANYFKDIKDRKLEDKKTALTMFDLLSSQGKALDSQIGTGSLAQIKDLSAKEKADAANATKIEAARIRASGGGSRSVAASVDPEYNQLLQDLQSGERDISSVNLGRYNKSQVDTIFRVVEATGKNTLSDEAKDLYAAASSGKPFTKEQQGKVSQLSKSDRDAIDAERDRQSKKATLHPRLRYIEESGFGLREGAFFGTDKAGDSAAKEAANDIILIGQIKRARENLIEAEEGLKEYNFLQKLPLGQPDAVKKLARKRLDALTAIFGSAKQKADVGKALTANEEKYITVLLSYVPEFSNEYQKGNIGAAITATYDVLADRLMKGDTLTQVLPGVDRALIDLHDKLDTLGIVPLSKLKRPPPPPEIDPAVLAEGKRIFEERKKNKQ